MPKDRVYPAFRQGSLESFSEMSFVFLYKLKGKRVAFCVLNILRNLFLFCIW